MIGWLLTFVGLFALAFGTLLATLLCLGPVRRRAFEAGVRQGYRNGYGKVTPTEPGHYTVQFGTAPR